MSEKFDPYHQWLGIPASEQPPHHYRLLGVAPFEESATVIENAADRQMGHLRSFQAGKHGVESQRLLNEVAAARVCLLDAKKKSAYDQRLRQQLASAGGAAAAGFEADLFDPAMAEVLAATQSKPSATSSTAIRKTLPPSPALLIGGAVAAVLILGLFAVWWAIGSGGAISDERVAKTESLPPAAVAKVVPPPPPPQTSPPKPPVAVSSGPKEHAATAVAGLGPTPASKAETAPAAATSELPAAAPGTAENPKADVASAKQRPEPRQEEPSTPKLALPSAEEQQRLTSEINEIYNSAEAKDQAAKIALARKLLEQGLKDAAKPAEQFVLYRRAGEIACDAGESGLMLAAVDLISADGFDIRPFQVKARLLERLAEQRSWGNAHQVSRFGGLCVDFADEAASGDAAKEADDVLHAAHEALVESRRRVQKALSQARAAATRARTPALGVTAGKKAAEAQAELEAIDAALRALTGCAKELEQAPREQDANHSVHPCPPPATAPFDEKTAKQHQTRWAKYLGEPIEMTNSVGMKLVLIPPGEFAMGSPQALIEEESKAHAGDRWYLEHVQDEGPQHNVRITTSYWLGATLVTQNQYQRVMGSNPSRFQGDPRRPVERVSWNDAAEFCRRLSQLPEEKLGKRQYALPTEAQWEYACRSGNLGAWSFSPQPGSLPAGLVEKEKLAGEFSWFKTNAGDQTHPVGQKRANAWGLYDMCGNVWQWCQDWHDKDCYANSPTDDPAGPPTGSVHSTRGGSWNYPAYSCRPAYRNFHQWGANDAGFRVCLVVAGKGEKTGSGPLGPARRTMPAATFLSARWGGGSHWVDVTTQVSGLLEVGTEIWANTGTLKADPTPGWKKSLEITYIKGGQKKTISVYEDKSWTRPTFGREPTAGHGSQFVHN